MTDAVHTSTAPRPAYRWGAWAIALGGAAAVVLAAMAPPFVGEGLRALVGQAFGGICHQLPARSPHVGGVPLALCDRCLGIYGGVVLGVVGFALRPRWGEGVHGRAGPVLVAALVPLAIDWAGPVLGAWPNAPLSRAITGAFFGVAAGLLVGRMAARFNQPTARSRAPSRAAGSAP